MKKLLYVAVIAALFVSCSVEDLHDENSIDLIVNSKGIAPNDACGVVDIVNSKGDYRGTAEAFIETDKGTLTIKLTTYDWKIRVSKLFFGPVEEITDSKPGLFDLGKYDFNESFKDGVYTTNYVFLINNIESDFCLMAKLGLSNDTDLENAFTLGTGVPGSDGEMYVENFLQNCLK